MGEYISISDVSSEWLDEIIEHIIKIDDMEAFYIFLIEKLYRNEKEY